MNFRDGIKRMQKYGGIRLGFEYCRMGLAGKILRQVCICIIKRKPIKTVYYDTNKLVTAKLLDKYDGLIRERILTYKDKELPHEKSKIVWFCWLQGKEQMPDIVRACYNSQTGNIKGSEFRFVDEQNWREYVELPEYLVEKYKKGYMPAAMFTDLIRLELLIKYGGTWIDSTVLCTGNYDESFLNVDIFMYQYGRSGGVSNWFITACTNNLMLLVIRDVLYAYWSDHDVVLNYYIFHMLFCRLMPEYPELISKMPYADSYQAISLVHNWHKPFKQKTWDKQTSNIHFHKLAWSVRDEIKKDKANYYNHILNVYLQK